MWRRKQSSSSTEVGCIACEELSLVGAGKEGWLVEDPNLVCALDTHALALAHNSLILLLGFGSSSSSPDSRVSIRPDLSPIESEHITAIEWLVFEDYDIRVVVAGTSSGYLLFYSLLGHFIHKQVCPTLLSLSFNQSVIIIIIIIIVWKYYDKNWTIHSCFVWSASLSKK